VQIAGLLEKLQIASEVAGARVIDAQVHRLLQPVLQHLRDIAARLVLRLRRD
jgi:hypothetical protein